MRACLVSVSLLVVLLVAAPREAAAQGLPLPRLDHVNIFVSAQKFLPGADLVRDEDGVLYGWGFETSFEAGKLGLSGEWLLELAVGYDEIAGLSSKKGAYEVHGSLRGLPTVASYVTHTESGLYFGVKTGLINFADFRAYDAMRRPYGMSANTIALGAGVGWAFDFGLAFEVAYDLRWFPGISYTLPEGVTELPDDLPRSMQMHGVSFFVSFQIDVARSVAKPEGFAGDRELAYGGAAAAVLLVAGPARVTSHVFSGDGHAELFLVDRKTGKADDCAQAATVVVGPVPGISGTVVVGADAVLCARAKTPEARGRLAFTGITGL